ncbi:serine/threonine-protein kinase [Nocardioides sp. Bht2]|uniref:serine/threonine-protein kinase n=1 Tax=Nocardioides sp. Bht2 TaxID=3392297 RepID=UPI0039B3B25C
MGEHTATGGLIPNVELGAEIGRGGFARVYQGRQRNVDRMVAVKIDDRVLDDERGRRRFLREVTAAGRISSHPHVVSLIDAGTTPDNRAYLVMELCPGGTLSDHLRRTGPMPVAEARDVGLAIVGAVAAAHEAGVLHRDIKPSNVLIDAYGTPRLADFGLAALPVAGQELSVTLEALTPAYAAPEAFSGLPPSEQSDIWSLGATLHALISPYRSPRWSGDGSPAPIDQVIAHLNTPLPDPGSQGSAVLMGVIARATHPDPAQRFGSAREMHDALAALSLPPSPRRSVLGGPEAAFVSQRALPGLAQAEPSAPSGGRRKRSLVLAAALGLLFGGVATWGVGELLGDDAPAAAEAPQQGGSAPADVGNQAPAVDEEEPSDGPSTDSSKPAKAPSVDQCFVGLTKVTNTSESSKIDCSEPHHYEAYATGLLDPSTKTPYLDELYDDPVVKKTCTEKAAKKFLAGREGNFEIDVLPPPEVAFINGDRGFYCFISEKDAGLVTGSLRDASGG